MEQPQNRVQWVYAAENNRELEARYDEWAPQYESRTNGRSVAECNRLATRLDGERFDVLILNSRTPQAISVTHPNFFPKAKFGRFDDLVERLWAL